MDEPRPRVGTLTKESGLSVPARGRVAARGGGAARPAASDVLSQIEDGPLSWLPPGWSLNRETSLRTINDLINTGTRTSELMAEFEKALTSNPRAFIDGLPQGGETRTSYDDGNRASMFNSSAPYSHVRSEMRRPSA